MQRADPRILNSLLAKCINQLSRAQDKTDAIEHLISQIQKNPELLVVLDEYLHKHGIETDTKRKPDVLTGRKVLDEKEIDGVFLRQELVPCRSPRCKKDPDLHGPYWYSYKKIFGKWVVRYHGVNKPNLKPEFTATQAMSIIKKIGKQSTISEDDLFTLQKIIAAFSEEFSREAAGIKENAIMLIDREEKRRKKAIHERHDILLSKSESGKRLKKEEQKELRKATALLADEH